MDRGASTSVISEIGADANYPVHLLEVELDTGIVLMTDANRDIIWDSKTYNASGHFLQFGEIEESAEIQINVLSITWSGVDQAYISLLLSENYIDRTINVYKAFLNNIEAVVSDPILIFSGRISGAAIGEDPDAGSCTIGLQAASQWVDFERRPGRHTIDSEQQIYFPGDKGFEFSSEITKEIKWGRA